MEKKYPIEEINMWKYIKPYLFYAILAGLFMNWRSINGFNPTRNYEQNS